MLPSSATVKFKDCDKDFLVTYIDFVNTELEYIADDMRCRIEMAKFKDIESIKFEETK